MKNLKTIESKVKAILQKNEEARNDDMISDCLQHLFERRRGDVFCRGNGTV